MTGDFPAHSLGANKRINLTLEHLSVNQAPARMGGFDDVIAHVFYSWPASPRDRLMAICRMRSRASGGSLGRSLLPLGIESYVTILDLGPWGAVYTQGWERAVATVGAAAKTTKQTINCHRIYPPLN